MADKEFNGIGTLNERSLHAYLKRCLEPDTRFHEVKVGRYTADILNESGIIEIQTRSFSNFRRKLTVLLSEQPVTVVYPIAAVKRIIWVNPETGEPTPPRKSPKKGSLYDLCSELIYIPELLCSEKLKFRLVFMEITDIRSLTGWSRDRKKGSERTDCLPVAIHSELTIGSREDYRLFLPPGLPEVFKVKDFARMAHITPRLAGKVLYVLKTVGIVRVSGKERNAFLYETVK